MPVRTGAGPMNEEPSLFPSRRPTPRSGWSSEAVPGPAGSRSDKPVPVPQPMTPDDSPSVSPPSSASAADPADPAPADPAPADPAPADSGPAGSDPAGASDPESEPVGP
jgi:hypothetical protein